MTDNDDITPPRTPSAMHRLGLCPCPKCKGTKLRCDLCGEAGYVAVDVAIQWNLEQGDTDPPKEGA